MAYLTMHAMHPLAPTAAACSARADDADEAANWGEATAAAAPCAAPPLSLVRGRASTMSAARRRAWAASALQEPSNWSGEAFDDEDDDEVEVEEAVAGALGWDSPNTPVSRRISAMREARGSVSARASEEVVVAEVLLAGAAAAAEGSSMMNPLAAAAAATAATAATAW